jgi:lipopolysaccharide export system protein LptA
MTGFDLRRLHPQASNGRLTALPVALLCAALLARPALAERADRSEPTVIVADHQTVDDLKQVSVFTGHVILTKGTVKITGERLEYREDPEGYQYAVVTAAPQQLSTFHERRDPTHPGIEETIDGVAERIEYDNKQDTVKLFTRAVVKRFENGISRDEFKADRIVYDARNSHYDLVGGGDASGSGTPRVVSRIAPRRQPEAAAPNATKPAAAAPAAADPVKPVTGGSGAAP